MNQWDRVKQILQSALDLAPHERAAFVAAACGDDRELSAEVHSLLLAHEHAGSFGQSGIGMKELGLDLVGRDIGAYHVLSLLGAGGMGEVYRARDSKLGRDVAIKVLPAEFLASPDRRARFEREARLLAALNHPNIGAIHGIENADGTPTLILELVEGETLAERIARAPIGVDDAVRIARQIADAVGAAHEKGIVHRDLKPANIKVTPDGVVKVLDFGLAKMAMESDAGAPLSETRTHEGAVLGTVAYMSPEQARGQQVDKRSDIWAFGCVLYEMVTGRTAFAGDTASDTIAAILEHEPEWSALPSELPPMVQVCIRRCLQKNPRDRIHDMADVRLALEGAFEVPARPAVNRPARTRISAALVVALLVGAITAGAIAWTLWPEQQLATTPNVDLLRFSIETPSMPNLGAFSVSPDGRAIAFTAAGPNGSTMLFVRPVGSLDARAVPGTEGALRVPFWSPDSRSLAFWEAPSTGKLSGHLKTIEATGGRAQILCEVPDSFNGGTWNSDNVIVFSSSNALHRVTPGGTATVIAKPDKAAGEVGYFNPEFLPDGRQYIYFAWNMKSADGGIFARALDSTRVSRMMQSESMAAYAPPHFMLFMRQQTLLAQRFDASSLTLSGEPTPIAQGVWFNSRGGRAAFGVSDTGILVYRTGTALGGQRASSLQWIDRTGNRSAPFGDALSIAREGGIGLSPDGKWVVFTEPLGSPDDRDVWLYDLERHMKVPLTSDPSTDHQPVWSPDGSRIAFDSNRGADSDLHRLYEKRADAAVPEQLLLPPEPGVSYGMWDWTPAYMVFGISKPAEGIVNRVVDLWARPSFGDRKPFRYFPNITETSAALSPNGRWFAYTADQAGTKQVIVQSFPDRLQRRYQVSSKGGAYPRWRRDGRELFYLDPDRKMIAVSVLAEDSFSVQKSTELFTGPPMVSVDMPMLTSAFVGSPYDVTADGQRFLFSVDSVALDRQAPLTVLSNWTALLKR